MRELKSWNILIAEFCARNIKYGMQKKTPDSDNTNFDISHSACFQRSYVSGICRDAKSLFRDVFLEKAQTCLGGIFETNIHACVPPGSYSITTIPPTLHIGHPHSTHTHSAVTRNVIDGFTGPAQLYPWGGEGT